MGLRFGKEFHASGLSELLEKFDNLGCMVLKLFDGASREGNGAFEEARVGFGHFDESLKGRNVGTFSRFGDRARVLVVVVVVVVCADVEEAIALEVNVLMYLEIEADCFHDGWDVAFCG